MSGMKVEIEKIIGLEPGKSYIFQIAKQNNMEDVAKVVHRFAMQGGFHVFIVVEGLIDRVIGVDSGEYITWEDLEKFELSDEQKELYREALRRKNSVGDAG